MLGLHPSYHRLDKLPVAGFYDKSHSVTVRGLWRGQYGRGSSSWISYSGRRLGMRLLVRAVIPAVLEVIETAEVER